MNVFEKHLKWYARGQIPRQEFISNFLQGFDPDALPKCIGMLDDETLNHIHTIIEPSPMSEEEWTDLYVAHRVEADELFAQFDCKLPLGHGDRVFIVDIDWAWHPADLKIALRRYEVYALRCAFGLPVHENDWSKWCSRNAQQIAETGLSSWIFDNRVRWYSYLNSGTIPWDRFELCPRPLELELNAEKSHMKPSVRMLLARIRLIEEAHPNYFFNIRRRLTEQLQRAWNISSFR